MRELGLCEGLVDAVQRRAGNRPVTRIRVRIGALRPGAGPTLAQTFSALASDTVAAGATLDVTVVPAELTCHECGRESATLAGPATCQDCGGRHVKITGGDEMVLEALEYAHHPGPTAPPHAAGFELEFRIAGPQLPPDRRS